MIELKKKVINVTLNGLHFLTFSPSSLNKKKCAVDNLNNPVILPFTGMDF